MYRFFLFGALFLTVLNVNAQKRFQFSVGGSYIEHFSLGAGWSLNDKNNISLLYGSNFFIQPDEFSSFLVQYEHRFVKYQFNKIIPILGVKSGYSIYTNEYYRWELLEFIPYLGLKYPLNSDFEIGVDGGFTFTNELSMERVGMGEIGWYNHYLPEFKIAIIYYF